MDNSPYFIWDYKVSDEDVRNYISGEDIDKRRWAIARILSHAKYEDVWKYLTPDQIQSEFPNLKLRPVIHESWKRALSAWGYDV